MTLLSNINVGGTDFGYSGTVPVGSCETPAGTQMKAAAFDDRFDLRTSKLIAVKFTYTNTYGDGSSTYPMLTVDGNSYPIRVASNGGYAQSGAWSDSALVLFLFDGTSMYII